MRLLVLLALLCRFGGIGSILSRVLSVSRNPGLALRLPRRINLRVVVVL